MSKFYTIKVDSVSSYQLQIEAPEGLTEQELWDFARDQDGGSFVCVDEGDWNIYAVDEITDPDDVWEDDCIVKYEKGEN
jgi:hypothetical protein